MSGSGASGRGRNTPYYERSRTCCVGRDGSGHPALRSCRSGARRDLGRRRHALSTRPSWPALILAIAQINVWNRLNVSTRQMAGTAW